MNTTAATDATRAEIAQKILDIAGLTDGQIVQCICAILPHFYFTISLDKTALAAMLLSTQLDLEFALDLGRANKIATLAANVSEAIRADRAAVKVSTKGSAATTIAVGTAKAALNATIDVDIWDGVMSLTRAGPANGPLLTFLPPAIQAGKEDGKLLNLVHSTALLDQSVEVTFVGIITLPTGGVFLVVTLPENVRKACQHPVAFIKLFEDANPFTAPEALAKAIGPAIETGDYAKVPDFFRIEGTMTGRVELAKPTVDPAINDTHRQSKWIATMISVLQGSTPPDKVPTLIAMIKKYWMEKSSILRKMLGRHTPTSPEGQAVIAEFNKTYENEDSEPTIDIHPAACELFKVLASLASFTAPASNSAASNSSASSFPPAPPLTKNDRRES
jgi:hypothetical protein